MIRQEKAYIAALVVSCITLQGCAESPNVKLPTEAESKAAIKVDQEGWQHALRDYMDCLGAYVEKMFRSNASAGDIADGAASSCGNFAARYASFKVSERMDSAVLYRAGYAPGEMEREMRYAPTADQIEAELAAQNRNSSIDYVLKLRAKFGG